MTLQWALGWWNLIYLVPFGIALAYLAVYVSTGIGLSDADTAADADASADADTDVDHDLSPEIAADAHVELDHDIEHGVGAEAHYDSGHEADHNTDHDAHHDAEHDNSRASVSSLLPLLGLGRVPTTLFVLIFLITWGISGFASNQVLHQSMSDGTRVGLTSLPIAAVITLTLTALLSRLIAHTMPMNEPASTSLPQLVGQEGVAVLPITETFGLAKVRGHSGVSVQVPCRLSPGQDPVAANERVRLMRFDRSERVFYVTTPTRLAEMSMPR